MRESDRIELTTWTVFQVESGTNMGGAFRMPRTFMDPETEESDDRD